MLFIDFCWCNKYDLGLFLKNIYCKLYSSCYYIIVCLCWCWLLIFLVQIKITNKTQTNWGKTNTNIRADIDCHLRRDRHEFTSLRCPWRCSCLLQFCRAPRGTANPDEMPFPVAVDHWRTRTPHRCDSMIFQLNAAGQFASMHPEIPLKIFVDKADRNWNLLRKTIWWPFGWSVGEKWRIFRKYNWNFIQFL